MTKQVTGLLIAFCVFLLLGRVLERQRSSERRQRIMRRGFWTDACYWAFTPLVTKAATRVAVLAALLPIALAAYGRVDAEQLRHGFGPAARLPLGLQAALMLIIADFILYWMHRAFHGGRLWPFHAVHHSSVDLDWLSAVRVHPVNDAVMRIAPAVPLIALGFAPIALAGIAPVLSVVAIMSHANVDWDFGPLRAIIASPRFHRWHHTVEQEGRDKNFSGLLPLWDMLFGTYYMPRDRIPERFGTGTPVPMSLPAQLIFPFSALRHHRAEA